MQKHLCLITVFALLVNVGCGPSASKPSASPVQGQTTQTIPSAHGDFETDSDFHSRSDSDDQSDSESDSHSDSAAPGPTPTPAPIPPAEENLPTLEQKITGLYSEKLATSSGAPTLKVFKQSILSYCKLLETEDAKLLSNQNTFGIVDLTPISSVPRLFIYNVTEKSWSMITKIGHGFGSDSIYEIKDKGKIWAESHDFENSIYFSNKKDSNQSSIGMVIIGDKIDYSKKLKERVIAVHGIDGALNDQVKDQIKDRGMWIHGADFDHPDLLGQTPLSNGCSMVRYDEFDKVFELLKGTAVLYYHERLDANKNQVTYDQQNKEYVDLLNKLEKEGAPARVLKKLKTTVQDKIEATYLYFKNSSKFVNQNLKSEDACLKALGI